MPKQKESNINDFAFDYLRGYYTERFGLKKILVDKDATTKQGHTAAGLFSFNCEERGLFAVALHTRQSEALAHLLTNYKKNGLGNWRYLTLLLAGAAAFLLLWQLAGLKLWIAAPLALIAAVIGFALHTALEKRYLKYRVERLLDDFKRTPGDEQWLGLSLSSLTFRNNGLAKYLQTLCERRGIGLITVGKRAKVVLLQEPVTQICRRGDFLSNYTAEKDIRKALLGASYLRVA